jgi:ABC-2 type transport system ATP-binding protein
MNDAGPDIMIRTTDLRVDYDDVTAVRDLNLRIGRGEVYGLIGPNGAGKTSTIRVLATLLEPTHGEVVIGGFDAAARPEAVHTILGYMPDQPPVHDELTAEEYLDVFAASYGLAGDARRARVEECLRIAGLVEKRRALAGTLSRGMKQRLVLAKTLLHDPKVLLLDEPASGLDPNARIELRDLIRELGRRGCTVLVSSHILTELADFCTSIGIMERGRMVESGRIEEIAARLVPHRTVVVELVADAAGAAPARARAAEILGRLPAVKRVAEEAAGLAVDFEGTDDDLAGLLAALVGAGVRVKGFAERKMGVEDIFVKVGAKGVS